MGKIKEFFNRETTKHFISGFLDGNIKGLGIILYALEKLGIIGGLAFMFACIYMDKSDELLIFTIIAGVIFMIFGAMSPRKD